LGFRPEELGLEGVSVARPMEPATWRALLLYVPRGTSSRRAVVAASAFKLPPQGPDGRATWHIGTRFWKPWLTRRPRSALHCAPHRRSSLRGVSNGLIRALTVDRNCRASRQGMPSRRSAPLADRLGTEFNTGSSLPTPSPARR
jgi:hypothetical protein